MGERRDVAVVLSGGGMNGVLLEVGFLQRLRESTLWPRIGCVYGTSAGALSGTMAALDRIDELETFLLGLQPEDTFRPQRLWRLPLNGLHAYELPRTIAERVGDPAALARSLADSPIELVVFATDVTDDDTGDGSYELAYSSWTTPPETMGAAVLASAAISALVLPRPVGDRIATDGGWVRNFPLGRAYEREETELIVAFRYVPRYPRVGVAQLVRLRERLSRFRAVPPVRAFIAELQEAEERSGRNEPAHLGDMLLRLMRVTIQSNTALEERLANEREASRRELEALRVDVLELALEHARPTRRSRVGRELEARFAATRLPRSITRVTVHGSAGMESLDPGFRSQRPWTDAAKRALIERGWQLCDAELRAYGIDAFEQAS
ncbi:MAG: patatin-like phospholipase family protein [Actinobacteria bacterium]|nr:patatin-like phospholipase family protein [Actinomycetota bacterium]